MGDKTNENKNNENIVKKEKVENKNKEEKVKKSKAREILEWIICIVIAFALALFIKFYIFTPTLVLQESMTPTILNGERVLINRLVRTFNLDLERGDIVTFEAPSVNEMANGDITATYYDVDGLMNSFLYYVMESGKTSYIKRVIGLPGDKVEIMGGNVYINDEKIEEDYLPESTKTYIPDGGVPKSFTVPEGYIFAMGDNRAGSSDCRAFGCVPIERVEGKVSLRIWPLNKFGGVD